MRAKILAILNSKYIDYMFYIGYFMVAIFIAYNRDFWRDEVSWTIRYVHKKSILDMLQNLYRNVYNLPLYYIVLHLFYSISHGQVWLRIPSIIAALGAVYYTAKFIVKYYGREYRILAYVLYLFTPIMFHIALQVRPYAFMVFFSAYSYWLYYERLSDDKWKNIIKFGIVLTLLGYSHWYGNLLIACYGLTDLYLWIRGKVKFKCVISYIMYFLMFLPWLILCITNHYYALDEYWGEVPSYDYILRVLYCLSGNIFIAILVLSALIYCLLSAYSYFKKNSVSILNPLYHISFIIIFIWTVVWLHSIFVSGGSLIEIRYFFVFLPQMIVLLVAAFRQADLSNNIFKLFRQSVYEIMAIVVGIVLVLLMGHFAIDMNAIPIKSEFHEYRGLLNTMKDDANRKNEQVLGLLMWEFFWDYYDEDIKNIDFAYYLRWSDEIYPSKLGKRFKNFEEKKLYKKNLHELYKIVDCNESMRLIAKYNNINKDKDFSLESICLYETVYIDVDVLNQIKYLSLIIKRFYDFEVVERVSGGDKIYKFTKKSEVN